jgi:hypothetical protein
MTFESDSRYEILRQKWEELKKLAFPESPGHPGLDNLYLELAEYDVYITNLAVSILEKGERPDRKSIQINEDLNSKLDAFNPEGSSLIQAYSAIKEHKQALDEFICLVLIQSDQPLAQS